jgi:hypothetical protein
MDAVIKILKETAQISILVAIMMILVDALNVLSKNKLQNFFINAKKFKQYVLSSFIGAMPGCIGAFTNVSLYIHGLISFWALAGSMIAVSGDEAFVMLAMFPKEALILFFILFIIGIFSGMLIDSFVKKFNI